ncbi:MAG TPA: CmpA/NrtA family ABC transporter substrate-binding protein [Pseudomonadales bacterium]
MAERITAAFVPLVDSAPLVAAAERGFAAREGIELELVREPSWASLRDHLNLGYVDCAHALAPLPLASALGVSHVQVACAVPFVLSRGGNAVTVSNELYAELAAAARGAPLEGPVAVGAALATIVARRGTPLTFGMVFPFSGHNFELRYWLAAAGIHPDRDVRLVAIPPPLMVESLRARQVDGFCVGEPWNSLAVAEGLGRIVVAKSALVPHGVEKVLAVRPVLAHSPERLGPLLRALAAAAAWADDPVNHAELAALLARPSYLDAPPELIRAALGGELDCGGGRRLADRDFLYFHRHGANVPSARDALWIYAQMLRWGQLAPDPAQEARAARVFRPDLYRQHLGPAIASPAPAVPFDGVDLGGEDVDAYLARFALSTAYVDRPRIIES